jgi:hypothetical protein
MTNFIHATAADAALHIFSIPLMSANRKQFTWIDYQLDKEASKIVETWLAKNRRCEDALLISTLAHLHSVSLSSLDGICDGGFGL